MEMSEKYSLESVEMNENFQKVSKSEIAFWYTFDQNISKSFQYFKAWIKSGLKVTFTS